MENEFHIANNDPNHIAEAMLAARLNIGRGSHVNGSGISTPSELDSASVAGEIPLLTYGQEVNKKCDYIALSLLMILFMIYVCLIMVF